MVWLVGVGLAAGACTRSDPAHQAAATPAQARSAIERLVILIQENHSFDDHFGRYCSAPTDSNPSCNDGPTCCEAGPEQDPGASTAPTTIDDAELGAYGPNHESQCELDELDGGRMDRFVTSTICGSSRNFAYALPSIVQPYWDYARRGALADRYFQPLVGASAANSIYFGSAHFEFDDNRLAPDAIGRECNSIPAATTLQGTTIADLLVDHGASFAWYSGGYAAMKAARARGACPEPPAACPLGQSRYPCLYDPSDVPFEYYERFRDDPKYMRDAEQFFADLAANALPQVSFVKAIGYLSEHPYSGVKLSDGVGFMQRVVDAVLASRYADAALVLVTFDEGGGYFDHVPPPANDPVDGKAYGTRVPLLALGRFARANYVSHVMLEHASILKFIEWNWLAGATGQLAGRDREAHNLGSLLDPSATGRPVPD